MKPKYKVGDRVIFVDVTEFGIRVSYEVIDAINIHGKSIDYKIEVWCCDDIEEEQLFKSLPKAIIYLKKCLKEEYDN